MTESSAEIIEAAMSDDEWNDMAYLNSPIVQAFGAPACVLGW